MHAFRGNRILTGIGLHEIFSSGGMRSDGDQMEEDLQYTVLHIEDWKLSHVIPDRLFCFHFPRGLMMAVKRKV